MRLLLQKILFLALAGICFSASGQVPFNVESKRISGIKADVTGFRKNIFSDSLMLDSVKVQNTDSIVLGYMKGVVRKKIDEAVNSASEKIRHELLSGFNLPAEVPAVNPFAQIDAAVADTEWQGQLAFDHFSGQAEKLKAALSHFDDLKQKGKVLKELTTRRDSLFAGFRSAEFLFNTGFIRPLTTVPSVDLYPSIGIQIFNKIVLYAGKTLRLGQFPGNFSGRRIAAEYVVQPGISFFLEGEVVQFSSEGVAVSNRHFLTGIKKTVSLKGYLSSFIMAGLDWGRQLPDDGYAERYRFRAGLEYKIIKKRQEH